MDVFVFDILEATFAGCGSGLDERLKLVAEEECGRRVFEGLGEELVVGAEKSHAVEGRAGEVVGDFFAEFAGEHRVDVVVGWFGVVWLGDHGLDGEGIYIRLSGVVSVG